MINNNKKNCVNFFYLIIFFLLISCTANSQPPILKVFDKDQDELILTKRITTIDNRHKAFTDLVYFDNRWFLTYRESNAHIFGEDGIIKIMTSTNGDDWEIVKVYKNVGFDLRDPKFLIKDNKLFFYTHGVKYLKPNLSAPSEFKDYKSQYTNKKGWLELEELFLDKKNTIISNLKGNETYPWRITYYKGIDYVFGYNFQYNVFNFYTSKDGSHFKNTNSLKPITGTPSEATLRIDEKGTFYSLVRREYATALFGKSNDLGITWNWFANIPIYMFGGPNFLFYKDGILLSGREKEKLILGYFNIKTAEYKKILTFDSGGDCSYPGMVIKDNFLWVSYYSQHEQSIGSSIYLSRVNLNKLNLGL